MKSVIRKVSYVIFAALLGIVGILLFSTLPIEGNYRFKVLNAGSMEPTLPRGTLIMVKPHDVYERGSIITFQNGTLTDGSPVYVTHRMVDSRVTEGAYEYYTKGDANIFADIEPVEESQILGEVIFHVPYVEKAGAFVKSPGGFFLLIIIPLIGILYEEWRRKARAKELSDKSQNH